MAQTNRISATISEQTHNDVKKLLSDVRQKLADVLIFNLEPEDRRELFKMGDKSLAFVEKSVGYMDKLPDIIPPYLDVKEAEADFLLSRDLYDLLQDVKLLHKGIEDALMVAGSEAFAATIVFYSAVKGAAGSNVAGAGAAYDDLKTRFPGRPATVAQGK